MSLSSYIQRQSRVTRRTLSVSTAAALSSIQEETDSVPSNNNVKAKRRQGVSDLRIPRNDDEWRLTLSSFPRPPGDEAESSGSSSGGSDSECSSGLLTTPTPSPTAEGYEVAHATEAQCIIRCKSIKPLRVAKRSVSPVPPPPPPAVEEDHAWIDDDDFYAAHAAGYITLAAPLPPSFPVPSAPVTSSAAVRAAHRESAIIPPTATAVAVRPSTQLDPTYSRRLSRRVSIPSRAPPPPPIITSHRGHNRSASSAALTPGSDVPIPNFSRPTSLRLRPPPSRPPPRTPVPCDATWSGEFDFADEYASYAPLLSSSPSPSPVPSSSGSSVRRHFPGEAQDIPSDVAAARDDADEWEEYDVSYDGHHVHNADDGDIPLSPLLAASPVPDSPVRPAPAPRPADAPSLPPYRGWHPRPRASVLREALARAPILPLRVPSPTPSPSPSREPPAPAAEPEPETPILRSRWSSSTLSSVHSAHARSPVAASKTNFAFARRYFPSHSHSPKSSYPPSPSSKPKPNQRPAKPKPKPKPMGANQALYHPRARKTPLTVADVAACASPDVFGSMTMPMPMPRSSSSPVAVSPAHPLRRRSRASSLSSSLSWSPTPSVGGSGSSDAGSECSGSVASAGSGEGLRRKPIPVEMFIR